MNINNVSVLTLIMLLFTVLYSCKLLVVPELNINNQINGLCNTLRFFVHKLIIVNIDSSRYTWCHDRKRGDIPDLLKRNSMTNESDDCLDLLLYDNTTTLDYVFACGVLNLKFKLI